MVENPLESIPAVGPVTADKLKNAGYHTLQMIAIASSHEIATVTDIGEQVAEDIIEAARMKLNIISFSDGHVHFTADKQSVYTGTVLFMPNGWVYFPDQDRFVPQTQIKEITN